MSSTPSSRSVLFTRDFQHFSGGHLKVYDYFRHVELHDRFEPYIHFSEQSVWDETNPWLSLRTRTVPFEPDRYDVLFLGGVDWREVDRVAPGIPVINIIQHVRHAEPDQDVYPFLTRRAIRVCVSEEVFQAVKSTGLVNGPIFCIENGVELPALSENKCTEVYIDGIKNPGLAVALKNQLEQLGYACKLQLERMPRNAYLRELASSHVVVLIPTLTEGFYLPALEAMKFSEVVVVPDSIGNRGFCIDTRRDAAAGNCFLTSFDLAGIVEAVTEAVSMTAEKRNLLIANAQKTVEKHSLERERLRFHHEVLDRIDELWNSDE